MRISIGKITKELGVKPFQLHKWEERGWLGTDPILKDPDNNNQRVYNEEQVGRIRFIQHEIQAQREQGIQRTDFKIMEEKLLDEFGGEVMQLEQQEMAVLPATIESFHQLLIQQNKEIHDLREMLAKREFSSTEKEHLDQIKKEMTMDLTEVMQDRMQGIVEEAVRITLVKEKKAMEKEITDKIVATKELEKKKGFWKRIFE